MKTFTDNIGRAWSLTINVDAIKRVKGLAGVDLLEAVGGNLLEKLSGDPVLLCDILFALCQPQAQAQQVSDSDFGRAMAGDAIDSATDAFLEELCDFFPSRRRALLQKALGKLRSLQEMLLTAAEKKIDGPEVEAAMRKALATFGEPSTKSPPSPDATQAPAPSVS